MLKSTPSVVKKGDRHLLSVSISHVKMLSAVLQCTAWWLWIVCVHLLTGTRAAEEVRIDVAQLNRGLQIKFLHVFSNCLKVVVNMVVFTLYFTSTFLPFCI